MVEAASGQYKNDHNQLMTRIQSYLKLYKATTWKNENSFFKKINKKLDRRPQYPERIPTPKKAIEVDFFKARSPETLDVGDIFKAKLVALRLR